MTLGAKEAGGAGTAVPLVYKAAAAAFVLSWGGLSVHAQIMSILSNTPMRYGPFLFARAIHALIAPILVLLLWGPLMGQSAWPAISETSSSPVATAIYLPDAGQIIWFGFMILGGVLLLLLFFSLLRALLFPGRFQK